MRRELTFAVAILALGALTTVVFAQRQETNTAPAPGRYLPEYTKDGDLILPKNWRSWVYVGSPLTPDALNNGKAGFPEYHNVYIEPGSYEIYKKTGEFPEGTIFFQGAAACPPAPAISRRLAYGTVGQGLFPR